MESGRADIDWDAVLKRAIELWDEHEAKQRTPMKWSDGHAVAKLYFISAAYSELKRGK
jgi:hypothetical protein